jgi:tetratricopeptide (TPR) repeat protein
VAERSFGHCFDEVGLHALKVEETNALVDNLLPEGDLTPASRQSILRKTDGNPFFVEEVIRTLIDRELIVPETVSEGTRWRAVHEIDDADMPGNLQSMLVARIDRLDPDARRTLQFASVIGRSFYYRVLESIHSSLLPADADLDDELLTLQRRECIFQAAVVPEREYVFRNALTQEATYSTILLRQRQQFHRLTGSAIEELFAGQLDEFLSVLVYHFSRADDPRAVHYATLAGDAAYRLFAIPEALRHYTLALETLRNKDYDKSWAGAENARAEKLIHLFRRRGRCLELSSEYRVAQENYGDMEQVAREQGDRDMLLAALLARATNYAIPSGNHDPDKAQELAEEALLLAQQLNDQRAEARVYWIFLLVQMYGYSMPAGIPFGEKSAELARQLGMTEQLAQSLQDLARCYLTAERPDRALAVVHESRPLWQKLNNLPMLAENLGIEAQIFMMNAQFDEAIKASEESLAMATSIDNAWGRVTAHSFVGLVYLARGEIDDALDSIQTLIAEGEGAGHPARILGWFYLSWLYSLLGDRGNAVDAASSCLDSANEFPAFRNTSLTLVAWQLMQDGELKKAGKLLAEAGQPGARITLLIGDLNW